MLQEYYRQRIRIPNYQKAMIVARAGVKNQLNLILIMLRKKIIILIAANSPQGGRRGGIDSMADTTEVVSRRCRGG